MDYSLKIDQKDQKEKMDFLTSKALQQIQMCSSNSVPKKADYVDSSRGKNQFIAKI